MIWAFYLRSVPFTKGVISGQESLGGSESACVGLMRALVARGHSVLAFAHDLAPDAIGRDHGGVVWTPAAELRTTYRHWQFDVFVALRMPEAFVDAPDARWRVLWNQDLLIDQPRGNASMITASSWPIDTLAYVSAYHRKQWEGKESALASLGWVTRNGFDPTLVPDPVPTKQWNRVIHISRPERGLGPLLRMWPELRKRVPTAELHICRYSSMYDKDGWGRICASYDDAVAALQQTVGGIVWLGELGKPALYKAIAEAAVMWYPGISTFAETSCWTPETPVAVPGGHKPIKDVKAGDLVLSYDESAKRMVAKRVKWCARTGVNRAVVRLTYKWKNGRRAGRQESIVGTPDHRMMRRDGSWTTLGELSSGDSLMPMFRKSDGKYWEVGHDGTRYRYEHQLVGEALSGRALERGESVHHIDGNGLNNHESNLVVLRQSDHIKHHLPEMKAAYQRGKPWFNTDQLHRMRAGGMSQYAIAAELGTTQATISRRLAASNHTVVSVEPAGFSDVWDMEVEDTHTFIAGHVVVHNCIAAIESQACGTPFVGSLRGALAETCAVPELLIDGYAEDPKDTRYTREAIETVESLLIGCRDTTGGRYETTEAEAYRDVQAAGRAHVFPAYTYDDIAAQWDAKACEVFAARLADNPTGVLKALLQTDDHLAARYGMQHDMLPVDERAIELCERVIAGQDQSSDDYATYAQTDPILEGDSEGRFHAAAEKFAGCTNVLDVACGNGAFALLLARKYPAIRVTGLDYSPDLVARANASAAQLGVVDRVRFFHVPVYDYATHAITPEANNWLADHAGQFDGLFVGEFLEHVASAPALVDSAEFAIAEGGVCVFTMPRGPFVELMPVGVPVRRGHVHSFEIDDINDIFGEKDALQIQTIHYGESARGSAVGNWIISYRQNISKDAGERDLAWRVASTRPMPTLSVGILADENAFDLRRCLESIKEIADEIVIGDSSQSGHMVAAIGQEYGATVIQIGRPTDLNAQPDGFAGARNEVLKACTGTWFLWIDTDETLEGAHALRKYLTSGPFIGYAIAQNHLMLDAPKHADKPVRLFKRQPDIQFYGCVHEQPQQGDCNGDIFPCLELPDVAIAHIGYRTEQIRRGKAGRNMPLLVANHHRFPTRRLNGVLDIRQLVLSANDEVAVGNHDAAERMYRSAIVAFERDYADPADKTGQLARPFYEMALQHVNGTWEFEYAFAGTQGALNGKTARAKRVRVRSYADLERIVLHDVRAAQEQMQGDVPDTTPIARPAEVAA